MVPVVLVVLVVLEVPGPEIRILREISSPELAGNRRKTKIRPFWRGLNPEWLTPEWVLVLVLVVLVVVLVGGGW